MIEPKNIKESNLSTKDIENLLFRSYRDGYTYHLSNSFVYRWESDFFCISKKGYAYEFEIKISRSDFMADFKKEIKHKLFCDKETIINQCGFRFHAKNKDGKYLRVDYPKHDNGKTKPVATVIDIIELEKSCPNKFIYVVPQGLIHPDELPDYAGLIYASKRGLRTVIKAPFIHKRKNNLDSVLLQKFYWKYMKLRNSN